MSRQSPLSGCVVAVTGGGNGIGRQIAQLLAGAGAQVAIGDRDLDAAQRAAVKLGPNVYPYPLDVTDAESFAQFLAAVRQRCGRLDVLVNNAGVLWVGQFDQEPDGASQRQVAVNLLGVIRGVKLAAPAMVAAGRGHIVTIASAASFLAPPGQATYAATKHGVLGYLKAVREELRGTGVQVSVIMPVVVNTEMAVGTASGGARLLQPDDVARAVLKVLQRPRFEVTVPGYVGPLYRVVNALPHQVRDALTRRLVPDQVHHTDHSARVDYETRFDRDLSNPQL